MTPDAYRGVLLASASPRRRDLLAQLAPALDVDVCPADIDEERYFEHDFAERSRLLAIDKAQAVLARVPERCAGRLLLAADTEVAIDGRPFGKAEDVAQATAMLTQLSGRTHQVVTAFCLFDPASEQMIAETCTTQVQFNTLSPALIERYVASGECFGKAGAYAIQGQGAALVAAIEGCYSNVVGLPLARLAELLQQHFAWDIWAG